MPVVLETVGLEKYRVESWWIVKEFARYVYSN